MYCDGLAIWKLYLVLLLCTIAAFSPAASLTSPAASPVPSAAASRLRYVRSVIVLIALLSLCIVMVLQSGICGMTGGVWGGQSTPS